MESRFETEMDPAPSYEESVGGASSSTAPRKHFKDPLGPVQQQPLPLQNELANARTQRINAILSQYVDPLLLSQGAAGIYKTTFVLVPSTVSDLQESPSDAFTAKQEAQVMGFPQDEVVKLVRLTGQEHAMEFWRQPAVVAELESSMKARLAASGHRVYDHENSQESTTAATSRTSPSSSKKPKKSLWSRLTTRTDDEIVDHKLGWRASEPQTEGSPGKVPTGMVQVSVVWQDVTLRIANEMGLFESKHGPALCLSVEVGT